MFTSNQTPRFNGSSNRSKKKKKTSQKKPKIGIRRSKRKEDIRDVNIWPDTESKSSRA